MRKDRLALQVYSVRDDMQQDFYGTLKKVKEMGYTGVEFAGLYGHDPLDVKNMCEEIGLIPISAHVPTQELLDETEKTVAAYKTLGVQYVVIPYHKLDKDNFDETVVSIKKIGEAVNAAGMVLQYHNHDFEFDKVDGKHLLDMLYDAVSPELLQTQIDTCWANVGGVNPSEYVKKYAGRTPTVHLKDFAGCKSENMYALIGIDEDEEKDTAGAFEFRPVGKGLQNFPSIVAAADESGAGWVIVEQDMPSMGLTPLECAAASAKYLLDEILV